MAAAPKKDDLKAKFEAAAAAAKQTKKKPDNATLLKLYSYYKKRPTATSRATGRGASTLSAARSTTPGPSLKG